MKAFLLAKCTIFVCLLLLLTNTLAFAHQIDFGQHKQTLKITDYKTLRDDKIVKQDLDYSCGAASVATLLNNYFYQNTTEQDILALMDTGDQEASFLDMQNALQTMDFDAKGLLVSYDALNALSLPAIVYVKHRNTDHFSVIRGIDDNYVWLADPSLGNRILSKEQFLKIWRTAHQGQLLGKILVVVPKPHQKTNQDYFTKQPKQPSTISLRTIKQNSAL